MKKNASKKHEIVPASGRPTTGSVISRIKRRTTKEPNSLRVYRVVSIATTGKGMKLPMTASIVGWSDTVASLSSANIASGMIFA